MVAYGGKSGLACACLNVDGMTVRKLKNLKNVIIENEYQVTGIYLQELVKQHNGNKINIEWQDELNDYEFVSDNGIESGFLIHKTVQFNQSRLGIQLVEIYGLLGLWYIVVVQKSYVDHCIGVQVEEDQILKMYHI